MPNPRKYDVAIIGSGIGGSTLASILARQGLSVIVFEGGQHPRFTIGESMILETSEAMRALAEFYDVPELAYYSSENYYPVIGTQHGVKRHFSFVHHSAGEHVNVEKSLQAVIPRLPYGHEIHINRQDSDYFLTSVATSYGATVLQNTFIKDINVNLDGVEIITAKDVVYQAEYVIDAGGMKSILAQKQNWRHRDCITHSRTLFTHMIDVPCFNEVGPSREQFHHPYRLSEGTLHHIFKGGWLWVIPFNNHPASTNPLCSVGLQLDPRLYPQRDDLSPEEEFFAFIDRFPAIQAQFKPARAVRNWVRTGRLQYSSKRIVGDRFCLLGHAAGFIDPLYSKGLYNTMMSVAVLSHLLLEAHQSGDYSAEQFQPLEETTLADCLKQAGYATGLVGKWHLGATSRYRPTRRGFDEFFGFLHEGRFFAPPPYRGMVTRLRVNEPPYDDANPLWRGDKEVEEPEYLTDAFTREAVSFIERHKDHPFFLYLSYNAVHSPMQAKVPDVRRFQDSIHDEQRRVFAAMLAPMDEGVGKVLECLRRHALFEDTLVFFISDNGGPTAELTSSNKPLRGGKGQLFEGGIRVPFLAQWPGRIPPGKVYSHPVTALDILPTAAAAAEARLPARPLDGVDLLPYLSGRSSQPPHGALFWRYGRNAALRKENWKLVAQREPAAADAPLRLFDLERDPSETSDLAAAHPQLLRSLEAELRRINAQMAAPLWGSPEVWGRS